jgi:CheY-like chemotaxis protein
MDIQLPVMDGLEATRRLKQNPATQDITVVALTAFAMRGDEERMRAAGCDDYIAKPISYADFVARVTRILSQGRTPSP